MSRSDSNKFGIDPPDPLTRRDLIGRGALAAGALAGLPFLLDACGGGSASTTGAGTAPGAGGTPTRGGKLRYAMTGAGTAETLNPTALYTSMDISRAFQVYEGVTAPNAKGLIVNQLAQDIAPTSNASTWKIKVLPDVLFHDGHALTAKDVAYTLNWSLDPKNAAGGYSILEFLKIKRIRAVDPTTVEIQMLKPNAVLPEFLSSYLLKVFPDGSDPGQEPPGTGPFQLVSFTPGQRAVFKRFDDYRVSGRPYLDEVEIISINDPAAQVTALQSNQVDAVGQLPPTSVAQFSAESRFTPILSPSAYFTTHAMGAATKPFDDARVRQALRLLIDRPQIISNALSDHGRVANDLYAPDDPVYVELPQHEYDPEKAESLLAEAGQAGLTVQLATGDVAPGLVQSATLFSQQASAGGVTIDVKKYPTEQYYQTVYLKQPFFGTYWDASETFALLSAQVMGKNSSLPETQWYSPSWEKLFDEGLATVDGAKRKEIFQAAQKILWEEGGYIIPAFYDHTDVAVSTLKGYKAGTSNPFNNYDFSEAFFES